jgi:N-acetyl-1-D-myo-inositol-2-amino-2-deoxy-alpha-D-glucopyranoside deacetylase
VTEVRTTELAAAEVELIAAAPARSALFVHAHPDDEVINNGATMARYVAEGVHVTLVTCTLGELGEVLVPELAGLAADAADQLGGYRVAELQRAMAELGVTDHRFLGGPGRYRDSGMMGLDTNDDPRCFWQADTDEAAGELVGVIREVRPQVLVTYDENGGYGHPDHIQAHRVAMRAAVLAADPTYDTERGAPWDVPKVYWCATPKSVLAAGIEMLRAAGEAQPFGLPSGDVDDLPFGTDDALVTTMVDGTGYVEAKLAAMRAHATQIAVDGVFFALADKVGRHAMAAEFYTLVRGERGPAGAQAYEDGLFAGLA